MVRAVLVRSLLQVAFLAGIYVASDAAARGLSLPVPGNVVGAIVLLALLRTKIVRLSWVENGAKLLLDHLGLLFVPAAVGAVAFKSEIGAHFGPLAAAIVISTVAAMIATAVVASRFRRSETEAPATPDGAWRSSGQ